MAQHSRPPGLKLIIAYKFLKAPAMLALAGALTFAPAKSMRAARHVAFELSEGGGISWRLAHWLEPHLTTRVEHRAAAVAWLDGVSTLAEGLLLLSGKAWGEWIVVAGLSLLVPVEVIALVRRPRPTRALVLAVNAAVVVYLARRRLKAVHHPQQHGA
jgi:Predicted membrane protein (DUF2127)